MKVPLFKGWSSGSILPYCGNILPAVHLTANWPYSDERHENSNTVGKWIFWALISMLSQKTSFNRLLMWDSVIRVWLSPDIDRVLSQFSECLSNLSAVNPVLSTDVPGKSTENQFFWNHIWLHDWLHFSLQRKSKRNVWKLYPLLT